MKKTNKLIYVLVGTLLAGNLAGCSSDERLVYERPSAPPQIPGYDEQYWVWDEEDGEWEYEPPGGDGASWYYYNGKLFKSSIKNSGLKSNAPLKSTFTSVKSSSSSKLSGFGGGFKGGGFGG